MDSYISIGEHISHLEKVLAEPSVKLIASGGGMKTETGSESQEIVLDGVVLVSRMRIENLVKLLKVMHES